MMELTKKQIVMIAFTCHESNRAWCNVNGDPSQVSWMSAEKWQKDSAIKGVEFVIANPDAPDSALHDAWLKDKVDSGWKYGPVKDGMALTHPCLVPFEELPPVQQAKDRLFRSNVLALLPAMATE